MVRPISLSSVLLALCATSSPQPCGSGTEDRLLPLVEEIRRADYAADRQRLRDLHGALAAAPTTGTSESLVRYWRGFALWRRAINGFNETPTPADLDADLAAASAEFEAALTQDPRLADAQAGLASCLGMRIFLRKQLDDEGRALILRAKALLQQAQALEPANPRVLWARGPTEWWTPKGSPPDIADQRQARAIATYLRGLEGLPGSSRSGPEPLRPTWGEPELHMSLAWSYLNRRVPDLAQAELHARKALELVPSWHYVRDILLPQIEAARRTVAR